ncbi:MAG: hypothetical protein ACYCTH_13055 [Cellulomonas sp.]
MDTIAEALTKTRTAARVLRELQSAGWAQQRTFSMVEVTTTTDTPGSVVSALHPAALGADSATATCAFGDTTLEILLACDGSMSVLDPGPVDFRQVFAQENRRDAQAAWRGDAAAALRLPGRWTVRVEVDLSSTLQSAAPHLSWHVLSTIDELARLVSAVPVWDLAPALDPDNAPVFVLEDLGADELLLLGRGAVIPLDSDTAALTAVSHIESVMLDPWHVPELPQAPRPGAIRPVLLRGTSLAAVEHKIWDATATLAWVGLASSVRRATDALRIEVLGLQRVAYDLPAAGLEVSQDDARRSYELFGWAGGADTIDQRLAVQQVVSLYRDAPPWTKINDVADAARAVFSSLRRDSVSEALQARRAARTLALDAGQRAADQVNGVTKSVAERLTASLLAIGGVIVAQTTAVIDLGQASDLRTLIALFLVGLAIWNIVAESPPLRGTINDLRADLPQFADTLTEAEIRKILALRSVTSAARRAVAISFAVPAVYLLAALVAWRIQR